MATNLVTQFSSILKLDTAGFNYYERSPRRHDHWFDPQARPGKFGAPIPSTVLGLCALLAFPALETTQRHNLETETW